MKNLSISECLSMAWDRLNKNWSILLYILAVITIDVLLICPIYLAAFSEGTQAFCALAVLVVELVLNIGLYKLHLNAFDGVRLSVDAWSMPVGVYVKYIFVSMCFSIIVYLGCLLCVIPGIWLACRLQFAPISILDDSSCSFSEAFSRSWDMTRGYGWTLFGMGVVAVLLAFAGCIVLGVGLFVAYPIVRLLQIAAYRTLQLEEQASSVNTDLE